MIRTALTGLALALFLLSCTSSSTLFEGDAPETTSDFDVALTQLNNPPIQSARSIDVKFEVAVANRTSEPVTVEHISLESLGAGDYSVPFRSRPIHRSVAPGAEEKFEFWAATRVGDRIVGTTGPLMLRTTLTLTTPGGKRTEAFIRNVNDWLGLGLTGNIH